MRKRASSDPIASLVCNQHSLEAVPRLRRIPGHHPIWRDGTGELCLRGRSAIACPVERRASVVVLSLKGGQPVARRGGALLVRAFTQHKHVGEVPVSDQSVVITGDKQVARKLPDRLEHPIALVDESKEALLDERLQG